MLLTDARNSKSTCARCSLKEVNVMRDIYAYNLTSDEDCCLMMMLEFFEDLGLPEDFDPKAFESLSKKFYDNLK